MENLETKLGCIGSHQFSVPDKQHGMIQHVLNASGSQHLLASNKQRESQQFMMPTKCVTRTHPISSTPQSFTIPFKKPADIINTVNAMGSQHLLASSKKLGQKDSVSGKLIASQVMVTKSQISQCPNPRAELFGPVRSKLRESLSSSLALVSEQKAKPSQVDQEKSLSGNRTSDFAGGLKHDVNEPNPIFPSLDISFNDSIFVQDELLLGNGLTWAFDLDSEVGEAKEIQPAKKQKLADKEEKTVICPQSLAFQIEEELFKLFGGVNKKYKEKGRSLLFNLKDSSNPELRERVMSGEISPKRLCSMSAEELASKELSEWRIAKAEELAQMVVLPDSEVDVRRLVRKTHKGEFQVEVEHDDNVLMEVAVGESLITQKQSRDKNSKHIPSNDENNDLQDPSLTILSNGGIDPMQGIVVDDELKGTEFQYLPPIVSLDEFMESLDSEPPFENLALEAEKKVPTSDKDSSDITPGLESCTKAPKDTFDIIHENTDKVESKCMDSVENIKPTMSPLKFVAFTPKGELVWDGLLQLSISVNASFNGFFRSGEKTSTKGWPSRLEIKGRVRLDAFEKFVQELPKSRSRAIMVVDFHLRDGFDLSERTILSKVIESYVSDERLGFSEPFPGVELYMCPPHVKILTLLSKQFPKEYSEKANVSENSLIGVIVWRKSQTTSAISPNKHGLKGKNQTFKRQHGKEEMYNKSPNLTLIHPQQKLTPISTNNSRPSYHDDSDDEVPPGFGPGLARDNFDLPEFKFTGGGCNEVATHGQSLSKVLPKEPLPSQVQQMRDLVLKYGKSGSPNFNGKRSLEDSIKPWDDEDDMPEWKVPRMNVMQGTGLNVMNVQEFSNLGNHVKGPKYFGAQNMDWR